MCLLLSMAAGNGAQRSDRIEWRIGFHAKKPEEKTKQKKRKSEPEA